MPNKRQYQRIKNDPFLLSIKRDSAKKWIKIKRSKYPFTHFSQDFHHRKKVEISPFQFWSMAKKQKLVCPLTGRKLTGDTMSVDHKIPLSKGGTHDLLNLQFVHVEANYAKRNLLQEDFIKLCKDVVRVNTM